MSNINGASRSEEKIAEAIVKIVFSRRRILPRSTRPEGFEAESKLHIEKILRFLRKGEPVHLILPAFPAKSPSRKKTLGVLPDKGEELAMEALNRICERIMDVYKPGARITICSDGRVFNELVCISDEDVSLYKSDLIQRIISPYKNTIDFFDLDNVFPTLSDYSSLREELLIRHGRSLEDIKRLCKEDSNALDAYRGICRFLTEDFFGLDAFKNASKNQVYSYAKNKSYRVVQRSDAWSNLLNCKFPNSIRLSIHPQPRVSEKIGIFLLDTEDVWRTPWHSVAIQGERGFSLVPRHIAESRDAHLVFRNGRPSYFSTLT